MAMRAHATVPPAHAATLAAAVTGRAGARGVQARAAAPTAAAVCT
jgi:hypothetical protein